MQTILKTRLLKPALVFLLVLFLCLSFRLPIGRASTSHQTIPTAPPTTSATPTSTSTQTPTTTSQTTVTSTQSPYVLASQTPGTTTSPTAGVIPSTVLTATGLPGSGTIPILTATLSPAEETQISATSSLTPTATVFSIIKPLGSSGILLCLLCGVIIIIFVVGLIWFLKSRQRQSD
jgi:hypothetical protein